MIRIPNLTILVLFLTMFFFSAASAQADDDILTFINGDRLTGEVKRLEKGKVFFDTDFSDTTAYDWNDVESLVTAQPIDVEVRDGTRYYGKLKASPGSESVLIATSQGTKKLMTDDIVYMRPVKDSFFERFEGDINAGFSFTRSSDVGQLSVGAGLTYMSLQRSINARYSGYITTQRNVKTTTQRHDFKSDYRRYFGNRWFIQGINELNRNTELGIDLRWDVGAGPGYKIVQSNHQLFSLGIGALVHQEWLTGANPDQTTGEAMLGLRYEIFNLEKPDVELILNTNVKPSLTIKGRVRADGYMKLSWEFIKDFTWDQTLFLEYDNKPQAIGAAKSDYGLTTGIGYSF